MAAIQKIRSYGVVLISVVGIALFAFIAEELVRAVSTSRNMDRQIIGEVYGEDINYEEFNKLYDQYENTIKMSNGGQSLTDDQTTQLRDQVWQEVVSQKIIEHEAKELGLSVSDAELQRIIQTGSSPLLSQTPFTNPQTGTFDVNQLKQFLSQYDEIISNPDYPEQSKQQLRQLMDYWQFMEQQVRQQTLAQKYQSLLSACFLTNEVSAKQSFENRMSESNILMAAVPYTAIPSEGMEISEKELKAKYDEMKTQYPDMFSSQQELRTIKYISVPVTASQADENALQEELAEAAQALQAEDANTSRIVRESRSLVGYNGLYVSRKSLPRDIQNELDSMSVGQQKGPYKNFAENTLNVIRFIGRTQLPDSVEFARIDVAGTDAQAEKSADSILAALQQGAIVDSIAKRYNQSGQGNWITSAMADNAQLNEENRNYIQTIFQTAQGQSAKIKTAGGNIIIKVLQRRGMMDKVNVAVVKREINFSQETATAAYNKLSSFLGANPTVADIEANAQKEGYTVLTSEYLQANSHRIANIKGTTEALRWTFDKAKKGDVSELYECGEGGDRLLVVMLSDIHKVGDRDINDANLKTVLEQEVIKDKKAAQIIAEQQQKKSVAEVAQTKGAVSDTIQHITFSSPVFVQKLASSEPALSGAVAAAKQGQYVSAVRGHNGVYAFQVLSQSKKEGKYDAEFEKNQLASSYMRGMNMLWNVLSHKANIKDNRYKFYQ